MRANDRIAKAENDRRRQQPQQQTSGGYTHYYNAFNLLNNLQFSDGGDGCRCCYDPNSDGGEYEALAKAKQDRIFEGAAANDDAQIEREDERQQKEESDSDSDDSEFDYLLDEDIPIGGGEYSAISSNLSDLQSHRRAELESIARQFEIANYHGYGVHRQMSPQRLFSAAGYGTHSKRDVICPKGSILHLYDAYSPLSVSLDLCLEQMATKYPGSKFLRGIGIASIHYADDNEPWKKDNYLPMLLAIRDGKVVAWSSGLRDFSCHGDDEVESRAVEQFLDNAGVLYTSLPSVDTLCNIRPEEEMLLENMRKLNALGLRSELGRKDDEDIAEEQRYECGVSGCCKSFFHEHVGVKNEAQDGLLVSESDVVAP